jgi:isopenicillin-N N-acyltransferase like protein
MRGLSDASGVPLKLFKRIHMIGELTKGTCSMFGAWGKATNDHNLIQLRALDWVRIMLIRTLMAHFGSIP